MLRLDKYGDTLWTRTYGDSSLEASFQGIQTFDGNIVLIGYSFSFGAGSADVYVIKIDLNGDIIWDRTYGGLLDDQAYSITQTIDSGFAIAGATETYSLKGTLTNGSVKWVLDSSASASSCYAKGYCK